MSIFYTGSILIVLLSFGVYYVTVTVNPVELWALPNSRARLEREFFDTKFGPFYRIEQVIITAQDFPKIIREIPNGQIVYGPAFNKDFLLKVLEIQNEIKAIDNKTFGEICFAPLRSPQTPSTNINECAIQSIWGYLQDNPKIMKNDNYLPALTRCLGNPYHADCFSTWKAPIEPAVVLGGFLKEGDNLAENPQYEKSTTVILTFLINNHVNKSELTKALEWEEKFVAYMKNLTQSINSSQYDIAFTSERSIEDELERGSKSDISTIVVSYLLMFFYIAFSLGRVESYRRAMIDSKITLGVGGVVIVLASVISSCGIIGGYFGVPATLIIFEVLPFLVLAVGVDNIFIIVQTHQRIPKDLNETQEEHIGRILSKVGPSILLTTLSESICFFLGGLSDMPAVKAFALYAGMALVIDFLLQISCFVSLLALDAKRQNANRWDILCFIRGSKKTNKINSRSNGILYNFFKDLFAPFLMKKNIRIIVVILFSGWLYISLSVVPHIDVGLDQELSMPKDSFVLKYFQHIKSYLSVGPPTYFVLKGKLNLTNSLEQNIVCGGLGCSAESLSTKINIASKYPKQSFIARPASSWIDDYFDWSNVKGCCKMNSKFIF